MSDDRYEENSYTFEKLQQIADILLKSNANIQPILGVICGTGLGIFAERVKITTTVEYKNIPNFPRSTAEGHRGRFVFGYLHDLPVVVMQGRFHYYEGYSLEQCSMPVRVMKLLGIKYLMVTNAAGGINPNFKVGDIMIINDHINLLGLTGSTPLRGANDIRFGPRFLSMVKSYDSEIIKLAKKVAKDLNMKNEVHEGVFSCVAGPTYETVAEVKMLKKFGVDAIGMSTVHEVVIARHCNLTVFGFSLITNTCNANYDDNIDVDHSQVLTAAQVCEQRSCDFMCGVIKEISNEIIKH